MSYGGTDEDLGERGAVQEMKPPIQINHRATELACGCGFKFSRENYQNINFQGELKVI